MAVYSNIVIDQGADYSASIDVTDSDGDTIDLSGYTAAGQIKKHIHHQLQLILQYQLQVLQVQVF
jgi:hypothetical protein